MKKIISQLTAGPAEKPAGQPCVGQSNKQQNSEMLLYGASMNVFVLILILLLPATSSTAAQYQYSTGQAFKESKAMFSDAGNKHLDSESTLFMKDVKGFGATEYFIWTGNLIKHGKNIRKAQNIIHDYLSTLGRGGASDEKTATDTLKSIFDLHMSITTYEKDVMTL